MQSRLHEQLVKRATLFFRRRGFTIVADKFPTKTWKPDIFGIKKKNLRHELMVEIETGDSYYKDHTRDQLLEMKEYMIHKKQKSIKVVCVLVVPFNVIRGAERILWSWGIEDVIKVIGVR